MISQEDLKKVVNYNPITGDFFKYKNPKLLKGVNSSGYLSIRIKDKTYTAHSLAFIYMLGRASLHEIDHINGCRTDNRWNNLREVTRSENRANSKLHKNNKLGIKGVHYNLLERKYKAQVRFKKVTYTATLDSLESAINWVQTTRQQLHKEFTNHG